MVEVVKRSTPEAMVRDLLVGSKKDRALLADIEAMVFPAQQLVRDEKRTPRGPQAGSPAPWFAPAAEFLDDLWRGAFARVVTARGALGWSELELTVAERKQRMAGPRCVTCCEHSSCATVEWHRGATLPARLAPVDMAGREALRSVPGLISALEFADDVARADSLEAWLRGRWSRARQLTGREMPPERLPMIPNPDHPAHGGRRRIGPVCSRCRHYSCARIHEGGRRQLAWPCPLCGCDSLRYLPDADVVRCVRSGCVDENGQPTTWALGDFEAVARDPWEDEA